ncbi:MAG: DivIVA domain-containing protein [Microbacteriaceae bacterium]
MSQAENGFSKVMRGYDPDEVDSTLQDLSRDLVLTKNQVSELNQQLRDTKRELKLAQTDLEQLGAPSYAGLGAKFEHTLRTAEETAIRLVSTAETNAAAILTQANDEALTIRKHAEELYQSKMAEVEETARQMVAATHHRVRNLEQNAEERAAEIADEALREASGIRGAIATEAAELRTTSKRETETLRAQAALEVAEMKAVILKEAAETLDSDAVLSQQIRQDLEVELAARRSQAEQEYLSRHQDAVSATQNYLDEANALLAEIIRRLNDKRLEVDTIEAAAESDAKKLREAARLEAEETVIAAEKQAIATKHAAEREAKKQLASSKEELLALKEEEKALRNYFSGMKSLITQASKIPASEVRVSTPRKPKAIEAPKTGE